MPLPMEWSQDFNILLNKDKEQNMWECQHCKEIFDFSSRNQKANHSRWCTSNPRNAEYRANAANIRAKTNKSIKRIVSDQTRKLLSEAAKAGHKNGTCGFSGKRHTIEAIAKITKAARESDHRRLCKSTRPYTTKNGDVVLLDSSWEEALACRLDELGIEWVRPKDPIIWIDSTGKRRRYFPNFYLTESNQYLDPKNPQAVKSQFEKIEWLKKHLKNLKIIESLRECKNFSG